MNRKHVTPALLAAGVILAVALSGIAVNQSTNATASYTVDTPDITVASCANIREHGFTNYTDTRTCINARMARVRILTDCNNDSYSAGISGSEQTLTRSMFATLCN